MILIIDNGGGFSYNLYQLAGAFCPDVTVAGSRELSLEKIAARMPSHIIVLAGLGDDDGFLASLLSRFMPLIPILGISSGHQAICRILGAALTAVKFIRHGEQINLHVANGSPLFRGLPPLIKAGGYYSLVAARLVMPEELLVIAEDEQGEVMGIKHKLHNLYGLQFNIESILTPDGSRIMENFLKIGGDRV